MGDTGDSDRDDGQDMTKTPLRAAAGLAAAFAVLMGADLALGGHAAATRPLVISGDPSPAAALYPGATVELRVSVTNRNDAPARLASFALDGSITSDDERLCPAGRYLRFTPPAGPFRTVEAGASKEIALRGALSMSPDAPEGCAGRTFRIPLVVRATGEGSY
jgi:hypothetical protein